ncbi:hypothetical protein ACP275_14G259300 [Erythranthe tilingii]
MDEDFDLAYSLQFEEALKASLLDGGVILTNADSATGDAASLPSDLLQMENLQRYDQELLDQYLAEAEAKRLQLDLNRQIHDRAFACEILKVPDEEWGKTGDQLKRPYGEGSSSSANRGGSRFRVYVKGLVDQITGGIGVAICDGNDNLVFELSKNFSGKESQSNHELVELKALIEGLEIAALLGLNMIDIVTDNPLLHEYITVKNRPMKANVATLSDQIKLLLRKFTSSNASLVNENEMKAFKLARNAMASSTVNRSRKENNRTENCAICFEDTYADLMFQIVGCLHSFCTSCMSKHVQFKLLQGILPKCPSDKCKSELKLDSCKTFLTRQLFEIMSQRMKEASIPAEEKIYCPYPRCSTLHSKSELKGSMGNSDSEVLGARKCPKCNGIFCVNCKVAWHSNMSCLDYKKQNPYPCKEDKKLTSLATQNLWRQCPKCSHMVSLATGCYHIYCRCGHEFCYTCGAEWKKKKATCTCPIWDENNIIYANQNRPQRG